MDILNPVTKVILLFCILFIFACKNEQEELQRKRSMFEDKAISIVGTDEYIHVRSLANDSIASWIKNNLDYHVNKKINDWQIDSLICFNYKSDKCIMAILIRATYFKEAVQDDIDYFNGVKINNQWYFFNGGQLVLPRESYQKDIHTPLSFEKMKQLAMKNIFQGYLKKCSTGQLEVNEAFFGDLTSVAWCVNCTTQAQWDSAYLAVVRDNWKKRDNTDYSPR